MTQATHPTLAQTLAPSRSVARDIALVGGAVIAMSLLSQVEIPLQPVPVTLQTLGVLLIGAALGWKRGALALLIYFAVGAAGLPVFSGGAGTLFSPKGGLRASLGFLIGFPFAAALVGYLVQRFALDRSLHGTALAMLAGTAVIYAFGLPVLAALTGLQGGALLAAGLTPFLLGDALKLGLAALLLPGAWALAHRK